jgi:NHLM bacteriocin system ABC transporter ATP-binding protein
MSGLAAAELLTEEGERLTAAGHRPFLLRGRDVWLVESGEVNVFAVPLRDGEPDGGRHHLFRVSEGRLILGLPGEDGDFGLLAVGAEGTELARYPRPELRRDADDPRLAREIAELLDQWVALLYRGLGGDESPVVDCAPVPPGDFSAPDESARIRPDAEILWMRHREGSSRLFGRDDLATNGDGFLPVASRAWLELDSGSRVLLRETAALLDSGDAWSAVDRLQRMVLADARRAVDHAREDDLRTLERRLEEGRRTLRRACSRLAEAVGTNGLPAIGGIDTHVDDPAPVLGGQDETHRACRRVGRHLDVAVQVPPDADERSGRDLVDAVARGSGFRTRLVLLREDWWRHDGSAMLARKADGGGFVALVPDARSGYLLFDPAEDREREVTEEVARALQPEALACYRPFEREMDGLGDLMSFGLHGSGRDVAVVLGASVAASLLSLVPPIATGMIFNDLIPSSNRPQLVQIMLLMGVVAVSVGLFKFVSAIAVVRIQGRLGLETQAAMWDRLLRLPAPFFRKFSAGDLAMRAMSIDAIRQTLSGTSVKAFLGAVTALFNFALLWFYSTELALWGGGFLLVALAVVYLAVRLQIEPQRKTVRIRTKLAGTVLQLLTSISKIRVAGAEVQAFALWAGRFSRQRQHQVEARTTANLLSAFVAAYPVACFLVLYLVAAPEISANELSVGDFLAVSTAFTVALTGVTGLGGAAMNVVSVIPLFEHAEPILRAVPEADAALADPGTLSGHVDVRHAHFRYHEDGPLVLRDVSLHVDPGEFVALVGPSGSGKSTVLRLMLGFEAPEKGSVYYDGQDLQGLDSTEVRRQVGVVLQDGRLMPGDIFTNIVGNSGGGVEEAWDAARRAGLAEDIERMPMGMHTVIGEGGGNLSGGQRQRLLVARAIVKRPRIFILDEATSALDNRTQAHVASSLDELDVSRIVVAHRLSTTRRADRIYVLDEGELVEQGDFDELMALDGVFASLARRQMV